jgi:hypothetical protein
MDQMSQTTAAFEADQVSRVTNLFDEAPPIAQANDHVYDRGLALFWGAYLVFAVALYAVTGYLVYRLVGALT